MPPRPRERPTATTPPSTRYHDNSTWNLHIPRSDVYVGRDRTPVTERHGDASSSIEIRLKVDTNTTQEKSMASPFDVTTYLPVDRPTHPYKQGLLERNRNNLYPKGLGSDRVSLGCYLPTGRTLHVCIHTCSWRCHVTRAFSFHANTRCMCSVCLLRSAFEESIDRGCPPRPLCLSSSLFPFDHPGVCGFLRDVKETPL